VDVMGIWSGSNGAVTDLVNSGRLILKQFVNA
jgi:hypothetical protein